MRYTPLFWKFHLRDERLIIHQGGTSSGKTWANLQYIYHYVINRPNILASVVSESIPHLKRGAMRDFFLMLEKENLYQRSAHNKTDSTYTLPNGSKIEFFGADDSNKLRGGRRDLLFINECNNVPKEAFTQLDVRTREKTILDYNPVAEFWIHDLYPLPNEEAIWQGDGVYFIRSTYKDNDQLDESIVKNIEEKAKHDDNFRRVYLEGKVGRLEGLVFTNWTSTATIPDHAKLIGYGLDFGYSSDPAALTALYRADGEIYVKELIYETGLTNDDLAVLIAEKCSGDSIVIADSAEPKSIEEINRHSDIRNKSIRVQPVTKYANSINAGIKILQGYKINVTTDSVNLIKEFRNYKWREDKITNKPLNKPVDAWNHGLDSLRYCGMELLSKPIEIGVATASRRRR